ncbi:GAF domain-containing protein [Rhodococcus sp. UFZ-B548]|uniref:GAF domain-containing protein n=1 Tax=Rhodococcus sp. UFZ-B548 TaxID=2742212 RepID=UPI002175408C|nr:GAF domain-containing protein [Rhodococcus sp. UFZ-B548]
MPSSGRYLFDVDRPVPACVSSVGAVRGDEALASELVCETGIDGAGVAVFAPESTRDLVYASDGVAEELDETQFTLREGPCMDAFRFDSPELHADMAGGEARARWPLFTAQVLALGTASVYAYPLGGGGSPFGVLELYGSSPVALVPSDDVTCRAYARHDRSCSGLRTRTRVRIDFGWRCRGVPAWEREHRFRDTRCPPQDLGEASAATFECAQDGACGIGPS